MINKTYRFIQYLYLPILLLFVQLNALALDLEVKLIRDNDKDVINEFSGSLMFSKDQIISLNNALNGKKVASPVPTKFQQNDLKSNNKSEADIKISPSFFINSILYKNSKSWVLWLNQQKFINKTSKLLHLIIDSLKIEDIKEDFAIFSFETDFISRLSPSWSKNLIAQKDKYVSKDGLIWIKNSNSGYKIFFKLSPHQTFILYEMQIKEGKFNSIPLPEIKKDASQEIADQLKDDILGAL